MYTFVNGNEQFRFNPNEQTSAPFDNRRVSMLKAHQEIVKHRQSADVYILSDKGVPVFEALNPR